MARDRAIRYYTDTSVWNQLVHQPGHPEYIARLKRARDEGTAQTYISLHSLQELVCAFVRDPKRGQRLIQTVLNVALRGQLVKDTPFLNAMEINYLADPSKGNDYLEPIDWRDVLKMVYIMDRLAQGGALEKEGRDFCDLQLRKLRAKKKDWTQLWKSLRKEDRPKFTSDKLPETFEQFLGDNSKDDASLAMVQLWTPKSLRTVLPLEELARRLEETVSFRAMLHQMTALYFYKVLKNHEVHPGDAMDAHHSVAAANFDVFVCKDENARTYASTWCRNGQRVVTLEAFIDSLG